MLTHNNDANILCQGGTMLQRLHSIYYYWCPFPFVWHHAWYLESIRCWYEQNDVVCTAQAIKDRITVNRKTQFSHMLVVWMIDSLNNLLLPAHWSHLPPLCLTIVISNKHSNPLPFSQSDASIACLNWSSLRWPIGKRTNWVPKDMSLVSISKPRLMY